MPSDAAIYDRLPQSDVSIEGYNVHFVDAGSGFPIVLVHGSPTSSFLYRHQLDALSQRFRVIAPDLLGFGRSDAPPAGTAFREQARVLRGLLDHLGLERYALVAHDWGGPVGMACAAQAPEQVSRLVLINTSLRPGFSPPWYWRAFTAPLLANLIVVGLNAFGVGLRTMMGAARDPAVHARYLSPTRRAGTRRTMLALERLTGYRALMEEVGEGLPRMQVPTLVLWGLPDAYFRPPERERLHALFPHAELRPIPGGGHFPQEDAPEAVTEALLAFFQEADGPGWNRP